MSFIAIIFILVGTTSWFSNEFFFALGVVLVGFSEKLPGLKVKKSKNNEGKQKYQMVFCVILIILTLDPVTF